MLIRKVGYKVTEIGKNNSFLKLRQFPPTEETNMKTKYSLFNSITVVTNRKQVSKFYMLNS